MKNNQKMIMKKKTDRKRKKSLDSVQLMEHFATNNAKVAKESILLLYCKQNTKIKQKW